MAWRIFYQEEWDTVVIKTQGGISYQDLPRQFEQTVQLAAEKDTTRFLFDDTELHINVSTLDIYAIPNLILSSGISRSSRIAVVFHPGEDRIDNYKFLETVCLNQGLIVKVFSKLDEAYRWLNK